MTTIKYTFDLEESSQAEDIKAVEDGLLDYNLQYVPDPQFQKLNIFVRNGVGRVVGGLLGITYWGWLYVSILWLDETLRGVGIGSQIMGMAEQEALRRGCHHVHLDTFDIQAPGFYEKLGYTRWGTLDDLPAGHKRIFYQKKLREVDDSAS